MIETLSLPILLLLFGACAVAIWMAGIKLTETADILSTYFSLGEALGGMILLAIVIITDDCFINSKSTDNLR